LISNLWGGSKALLTNQVRIPKIVGCSGDMFDDVLEFGLRIKKRSGMFIFTRMRKEPKKNAAVI